MYETTGLMGLSCLCILMLPYNLGACGFLTIKVFFVSLLNSNFETKNTLIVKNPQVPKLFGTIKIHKQDKPIRLVVSYIDVSCVKLSRKLNEVIHNYEYKSKYSV